MSSSEAGSRRRARKRAADRSQPAPRDPDKVAQRRAELNPWLQRDLAAFEWINLKATHPLLDWVMARLTHFGLGGVQLLLILAAAWFVRDWPGVRPLIVLCLYVFMTASFGATWIKNRLKRRRPVYYTEARLLVPRTEQGSFPSGHTCTSVAFAIAIGSQIPALLGPLLLFAALIGYSRIYVGLHFPGDVLGAIGLAMFSAGVVLGLAYFAGWLPLPPLTLG